VKFTVASALLATATGCAAERERSAQQGAVEYNLRQHYTTECADTGLLPGSAPFNDCVAKLEGDPPEH
jgi:hypothetical protein